MGPQIKEPMTGVLELLWAAELGLTGDSGRPLRVIPSSDQRDVYPSDLCPPTPSRGLPLVVLRGGHPAPQGGGPVFSGSRLQCGEGHSEKCGRRAPMTVTYWGRSDAGQG